MNAKDEIRQFVQKLLTENGDDRPLADDESLLSSGRLQSIDAVEIITFLEKKFGTDFSEAGFDREQLDSVDAIDALVESIGPPKG
jgi:acyl carrier protein